MSKTAGEDPLGRELTRLRRACEKRQTVPSGDLLRLLDAVETVLDYAETFGSHHVLKLTADGSHVREHSWWECDCPRAIPLMWTTSPEKIRELIEWRVLGTRAALPGEPS